MMEHDENLGWVDVRADIDEETDRIEAMFGKQNHHPAYWLALLGKQMGQLGSKIVDREWAADKDVATEAIYDEACQLAAVAVEFMEAIRRGDLPDTLVTAQPADPRLRSRALGRDDESLRYDNESGHMVQDVRVSRKHCNDVVL